MTPHICPHGIAGMADICIFTPFRLAMCTFSSVLRYLTLRFYAETSFTFVENRQQTGVVIGKFSSWSDDNHNCAFNQLRVVKVAIELPIVIFIFRLRLSSLIVFPKQFSLSSEPRTVECTHFLILQFLI